MRSIGDWKAFLKAAGPFLGSARPIEAMAKAGITLHGEVASAFQRKPRIAFSAETVTRVVKKFGPVPPINLHIGRNAPTPAPLLRPGNHQLTIGVNLALLNDVMKALWQVNQIPQQLSESDTDQLITLSDLRAVCKGIPTNATRLQGMFLTAPPVASASGVSANIHFEVSLRLAVEGSTDARLLCTLHVELPLGFQIPDQIQWSSTALSNVQVSLNYHLDDRRGCG